MIIRRWLSLRLILVLAALLASAPVAAEEPAAAGPAPADNNAALDLFSRGRYAEAYAAFWPALERGDPEAVFHGLIIRRHGLDGRQPAEAAETAALTNLLVARAAFMRQALNDPDLPRPTGDAYRTALAQLIYFGRLPLPPGREAAGPEEIPARRRDEALGLISAVLFMKSAPDQRYPPAMNFSAYLNFGLAGETYPKKAQALLRKSAEAGDRLGMINLSRFYREGLGGPKDNLKAAHLARQAADASPPLARALNEVGYFYEAGLGVTADLAEARAWYEKSAARRYPPGQSNAARLKRRDRGRAALDETILF